MNSTIGNATTTNSTFSDICTLSPHARALSTVLTAFVGSIIGGISGGSDTAFYAAWICWMATMRILVIGIWAIIQVFLGRPLKGGDQFHDFYGRVPGLGKLVNGFGGTRTFDDPFFRRGAEASDPTFLGWVGWMWSTLYSPVIQTLWLLENWNKASGGLKLVRALGVSITALPLTIDTRARYGAALGDVFGTWLEWIFNFITATGCLMLGVIASIELVLGAKQIPIPPWVIVIYVLIMTVWTYGSLIFATPHDEGKSVKSMSAFFGGLAMGVFGGIFIAAPGFILLMASQDTPGSSLGTYLKCETIALWQKMAAILP